MAATIQKILNPTKYRAVDTSGSNNHGQIYSGRGLEFDGVSDYLSIPDVDAAKPTLEFTVACWVKSVSDNDEWKTIYGKGTWSGGIWIALDENESLKVDLNDVLAYGAAEPLIVPSALTLNHTPAA